MHFGGTVLHFLKHIYTPLNSLSVTVHLVIFVLQTLLFFKFIWNHRWVRVPVPVCVYYCISTHAFYYVDIASTDLNPIFAFTAALILCCIDSTKSWNRSSEIVVLIEKISSQSCCTSMIHPILPHPKDACWIVIWSLS